MKLMIGNQKGGVAKTTTAISLARCLADQGIRTLLVDSDPQGSIAVTLRLKPQTYLADFILNQLPLPQCTVGASANLDVLCSNRETSALEQRIFTMYGREHVFQNAFRPFESAYGAIIVDVAPSISLLQACSMVFCQNVVIPVSMDTLSVSGAGATIFSAQTISEGVRAPIRAVGLLPTIVNRRYALTGVVMQMIEQLSQTYNIPVLPAIRTDQVVGRAARMHQMIADIDPKAKVLEDYAAAADSLLKLVGTPLPAEAVPATGAAKMARSKKTQEFDPSELDDLILTPAVGTGVGSHLLNSKAKTTDVIYDKTTVGQKHEPTGAQSLPSTMDMWVTEAGDILPASRVKPIRFLQDVLNAAELAVYETLWNHVEAIPEEHSRLVQAGYHPLMKNTRLSKKTIQRVIDRLIAKELITVERPADIYERKSTIYRVFSFAKILQRLEQSGRLHAARIGPGVVYARPLQMTRVN